jgi:M-phase inducer tyrosine phosphatase
VDEFLSSDLELSFASTMSLHSPPRGTSALTPEKERVDLMDISPPPNPTFTLAPSAQKGETASKVKNRPRAFTSGARTFGRDMSNGASPAPPPLPPMPKSGGSQASSKRTQRSALPFEWFATAPSPEAGEDTNLFVKVIFLPF